MTKPSLKVLMATFWILLATGAIGASKAADSAAASNDNLKLERVVMLMRHGTRSPTHDPAIPEGYSTNKWPSWPVAPGELTPRGAMGIRLLASADRTIYVNRGLIPAQGCPNDRAVTALASGKQRAIDSAEAYLEVLFPGCHIKLEHPAKEGPDDIIFHPLDAQPEAFDGHIAWQQALALAPAGGIAAEATAHRSELELLQNVLGCCSAPICENSGKKPGCSLVDLPTVLVEKRHDRPDLEGPLNIASTASQSFLLEYLEDMPMSDVGWGRLSRDQIEILLRFHPIKFRYNNGPAYVAQRAAGPIASRMVNALGADLASANRLTLLLGHDTNIADLGSLLGLKWHVASYPEGDIPPGAALGFELLVDSSGKRFVRAFFRAQTMDQLRNLIPFDSKTQPYREYLAIPGCGKGDAEAIDCSLGQFTHLVDTKLTAGSSGI